jgi:hypothetical protein
MKRKIMFVAAAFVTSAVAQQQPTPEQIEMYRNQVEHLFFGEISVTGIVADASSHRIKNVRMKVQIDAKEPEEFTRDLEDGSFSLSRKDCTSIKVTFVKAGYHRESRVFAVDPSVIGQTGKRLFKHTETVRLSPIGEAIELISHKLMLSTKHGGKSTILDLSKPQKDTRSVVSDVSTIPKMAFCVLPNSKNPERPEQGALLRCGDPEGGFALHKPERRAAHDSGSYSPRRYMRTAPIEGYQQEMLLPDARSDALDEGYFYFKSGDYFGKGQVGPALNSGDGRVDASIDLWVNTDGSRNVTTDY